MTDEKQEGVLVCMPKGVGVEAFTDNCEGPCASCGRTIVWRPHAVATRRICLPCARQDLAGERGPVEILITAESREEIRAFLAAASRRDPGPRH